MKASTHTDTVPHRILYTMLRVADLNASIAFYRDGLGMSELRRETFPDGQFTLVFMGYTGDPDGPTIELTWNWGTKTYSQGTGYGHIALAVRDIHGACARLSDLGASVVRAPGPMTYAPQETGLREEIAFVTDPDGYRIELVGHAGEPRGNSPSGRGAIGRQIAGHPAHSERRPHDLLSRSKS